MIASVLDARFTPAVLLRTSMLRWLRANLFASWASAFITLAVASLTFLLAAKLADWAVLKAVWHTPEGDATACRALQGRGACWALIGDKYRFLLFATYPYEEQWRPALACCLLVLLFVVSGFRRLWRNELALVWLTGLLLLAVLMWGGVPGLPYVSQERWGGLPVTLILATFGIAFALPLGILLALARRERGLPAIRWLSIAYIELIRGVPLISLLFLASFLLPLFMPAGLTIDKLLRAQIAFTMFASAYLAEVVRGGLQAVPLGQCEAARALGLRYWCSTWLVVLPQALKATIPAIVNTFIAILKSTSLVLIIGLFDLLSAGKAAIVDPVWQAFGPEMFVTVSLVYFALCFSISKYSQHLEKSLNAA
jgi:general L-amino acid transport system permease protein